MNTVVDKLGRPLRDLRISVTDQCNFRCAYCMPKELFGPDYAFLPKGALLSDDEIVSVASSFAKLGIQKIRLTGGEPLLRPKLDSLIARLVGEVGVSDISLTTNASLLPRFAKPLKAAGLKRLNVSLDSLDAERFGLMSGGRSSPQSVLKGTPSAASERSNTSFACGKASTRSFAIPGFCEPCPGKRRIIRTAPPSSPR